VKSKKKEKLTIQCDEMWSFVCSKDKKQWIWLGIDTSTKELSEYILAKEIKVGRRDYGIPYHQFIVNVP
jgi:IS1 family transposase